MASRFAPLVKLKKEQLDEVQRHLLHINKYIQEVESSLSDIKKELLSLASPKGGDIALFSQFHLMTQACHDQILMAKVELNLAVNEKNNIQNRVNKAHMEYEKFLYLHKDEELKTLKRIKKLEANYLDEVAVMGYNLQQVKN